MKNEMKKPQRLSDVHWSLRVPAIALLVIFSVHLVVSFLKETPLSYERVSEDIFSQMDTFEVSVGTYYGGVLKIDSKDGVPVVKQVKLHAFPVEEGDSEYVFLSGREKEFPVYKVKVGDKLLEYYAIDSKEHTYYYKGLDNTEPEVVLIPKDKIALFFEYTDRNASFANSRKPWTYGTIN